MYWIYILRSMDFLKAKHASFDETVFPFFKPIQTEYVHIEERLEQYNDFSAPGESLNVTFPVSDKQKWLTTTYKQIFLVPNQARGQNSFGKYRWYDFTLCNNWRIAWSPDWAREYNSLICRLLNIKSWFEILLSQTTLVFEEPLFELYSATF